MKLLHTSDWHIGRALYGRKRYEEFTAFLPWLTETIEQQQVDALIVAGDIFDNGAPSNRAQELYYRFLCNVAASCCRHVVVVAGNHDSPSFLSAPKELLRALNVHVVGAIGERRDDEVLLLHDLTGAPELIVCAVPYLRDRDLRVAEAGESIDDKERKLLEGLRSHYAEICELAEQRRNALGVHIPIVATGHLFTAGGLTQDGDGVRELYVGSLAHVTSNVFPDCIAYLALGHLHVPQKVNGLEIMRYSGSPLPMSFGEARQEKSVCLVELSGLQAQVTTLAIPTFQSLERIRGNRAEIAARIQALSAVQSRAWLEIVYEGDELAGDLRAGLEENIAGTQMEILRIRNNRIIDRVLERMHDEETLDDLNVNEVFARCLAAHNIAEEQRPELLRAYQETIASLYEEDAQAQ